MNRLTSWCLNEMAASVQTKFSSEFSAAVTVWVGAIEITSSHPAGHPHNLIIFLKGIFGRANLEMTSSLFKHLFQNLSIYEWGDLLFHLIVVNPIVKFNWASHKGVNWFVMIRCFVNRFFTLWKCVAMWTDGIGFWWLSDYYTQKLMTVK